ncbi:unnamed protein product [Acidithrix sp. C25]|nr:unnamed protein product [Acidithrix sp. C25]
MAGLCLGLWRRIEKKIRELDRSIRAIWDLDHLLALLNKTGSVLA